MIRPRLALAALVLAGPACAQNAPDDGPAVAFERQGASVCARYAITGKHHLYPKRLAALAGSKRLELSGVPSGRPAAGSSEPVAQASFVACAQASGPVRWLDQSCLAAQGVCLPPRGFDIDAEGRARQLPGGQAASAYAQAFAAKADSGWGSFLFKPR